MSCESKMTRWLPDRRQLRGRGASFPASFRDDVLLQGTLGSCVCACMLSCFRRVQFLATPRTIARQAPLSLGFSRQEYWSGLPCPPLGDLPNPGIKPTSPALQADSLPAEPPEKPTQDPVGAATPKVSHSTQGTSHLLWTKGSS